MGRGVESGSSDTSQGHTSRILLCFKFVCWICFNIGILNLPIIIGCLLSYANACLTDMSIVPYLATLWNMGHQCNGL